MTYYNIITVSLQHYKIKMLLWNNNNTATVLCYFLLLHYKHIIFITLL